MMILLAPHFALSKNRFGFGDPKDFKSALTDRQTDCNDYRVTFAIEN